MGACVCRSHELSGLLLSLAACLALDPVPPPGCPLVVYAGGQVKEGAESGCLDGGTGYWSSCETGEVRRCLFPSSGLLFSSSLFYVAVSVLGSVRLEQCLHELAVVGLRCE